MEPQQLELPTWGGRRKGAGRKAVGPLRLVSHRPRPVHLARHPLHAVWRTRPEVPSLRGRAVMDLLRQALGAGGRRAEFRLIHYSVQGNHLHLVVEAHDKVSLSRGMQGLAVRAASSPTITMRASCGRRPRCGVPSAMSSTITCTTLRASLRRRTCALRPRP
jgi:hypothetical protein